MAKPDDTTLKFITRLKLGTLEGKVHWTAEAPPKNPMWFSVTTDGGQVLIRSEDEDGDHPYYFEISNSEGIPVARAETTAGEYYSPWEAEMGELFESARNSALGVDTTLDSIGKALELPELPKPQASGGEDDIPF